MVYNRRASDMHIGSLRPAQGVNLILEKDGERKKGDQVLLLLFPYT